MDKKLASLLRKLYHVYSERKIGYEFRTISIFYEIMYILVKDYRVTETREKDIRHSRRLDALSKITTYMREHYREELKLSDVAATFGYTMHICRECSKNMQKSTIKLICRISVWHMRTGIC